MIGKWVSLAVLAGMLAGCATPPPQPAAKAPDKGDRFYAEQAESKARLSPVGLRIAWSNPATGHSGAVTATRDAFDRDGAYCRDFQSEITAAGPPRKTIATLCRQPDGSWRAGR